MPSKDNRHILRYVRTDDVFDEIWQPVSNSWQDPASVTLIAHDMYHHEPTDTGTYAQEVATFGAEFYINLEGGKCATTSLPDMGRSVAAVILLVVEKAGYAPLRLSARRSTPLHDDVEQAFSRLAQRAFAEVLALWSAHAKFDDEVRALGRPDAQAYMTAFTALMRQGYRGAKKRFPDQMRVRLAMRELERALESLGPRDVPPGHEVEIELTGYDCQVRYQDPDVCALEGIDYATAYMMSWSQMRQGWGSEGISLTAVRPNIGSLSTEIPPRKGRR